jgi:NDP-sugar pyrophosphorylase family protein
MILAAGLGTRLGSLGKSTPKVLLELGGEPLLQHHLRYLHEQGVARVVVNAHHRADLVEDALRSYRGPLEVVCVHEPRLLGTAGGVRHALSYLEPGPFLVLYGDVLVREPIREMFALHRGVGAAVTLAVHAADSTEGKGVVDLDAAGWVRRFAEKERRPPGPAWINSGIYVLEADVVRPLEPGAFYDFGEHVFPSLVRQGRPMAAFRLGSPVIDVGTPAGLRLGRAVAGR